MLSAIVVSRSNTRGKAQTNLTQVDKNNHRHHNNTCPPSQKEKHSKGKEQI
jgi:hypothetical protein